MASNNGGAKAPEMKRSKTPKPAPLVVRDGALLPLKVVQEENQRPDPGFISDKFYNSFNFSKLTAAYGNLHMTLGVTSAKRGEGKTIVASNMAVSLAKAYHKPTILVDLNFRYPKLHTIFGIDKEPGVSEAIQYQALQVTPTAVPHLHLLTSGNHFQFPAGIEHTLLLRKILQTLKNEFEFVIIDMCSIFPIHEFPVHFINEIDGLINVIDTRQTKKTELNSIFRHIDETRFVGYVLNKVDDPV